MKELMKGKYVLVLALLALIAGCGKMTLVNSPREKEGISLVENAHYDSDSKIRYMVSNDNTHVYLRFDTDNYATIMRVRKLGAIVHFDTNGKRKGTHSLKYPVYLGEDDQNLTIGSGDPRVLPGGMLKDDLFPPTTTATWIAGETSRNIDLGLNKEGFVCQAELDDKDVLVYVVGVPFTLLGGQRPEDFANLTMELEIPSPDTGSKTASSNPDPGSSMPGSMNTGVPGSSPGSMSGAMPGGGMMSSGGVSGGVPDISIWMEVKLSPSVAQ